MKQVNSLCFVFSSVGSRLSASLAGLALALVSSLGYANVDSAGAVVMSVGRNTATAVQGVVRTLNKDASIYSGELMNTGPNSYLNLRFDDGAFFLLRPETRFEIQEHHTAPSVKAAAAAAAPKVAAPGTRPAAPLAPVVGAIERGSETSRAFMSLLKGGFRSVSGLIGKLNHDEYRITTPVATIGIRGTRYSARVCDAKDRDGKGECADRDELVSLLRDAGSLVDEGQTLLITHIEDGSIEIVTPTETRIQGLGTTFITISNGNIILVNGLPSIEQQELHMSPDICGLGN